MPTGVDADTLWTRQPPANRGRAERLTAAEIADLAIAIADAEGLSAATVKRVANRLRVPSTRLENYLTSRDELHDLMLDSSLGLVSLPGADLPWRAQLEQLARETYRVAREHRSLIELIGARSPSGPNGLRFVEHAIAALASTGWDVRTAALSFNAVLSYVCGAVSVEVRRGGSARRRDQSGDAEYLAQVVSAQQFPRLAELFAEAGDMTSEVSFEHGLGCLLDGFEARLAERAGVQQPDES